MATRRLTVGAFVLYLVVVGIVAGYLGSLPVASAARTAALVGAGIAGSAAGGATGLLLVDRGLDGADFAPGAYLGCLVGAAVAVGAYGVARARRPPA